MAAAARSGQSGSVGDAVPPSFRMRPFARLVAGLLSGTFLALAIWTVADQGASGLAGALLCTLFAVFTALAVRMGVRATPSDLIINWGWRTRRIPWNHIEGFRLEEGMGNRRVLVLVAPDEAVALPVANGGPLLTRKRETMKVREALDEYRKERALPR